MICPEGVLSDDPTVEWASLVVGKRMPGMLRSLLYWFLQDEQTYKEVAIQSQDVERFRMGFHSELEEGGPVRLVDTIFYTGHLLRSSDVVALEDMDNRRIYLNHQIDLLEKVEIKSPPKTPQLDPFLDRLYGLLHQDPTFTGRIYGVSSEVWMHVMVLARLIWTHILPLRLIFFDVPGVKSGFVEEESFAEEMRPHLFPLSAWFKRAMDFVEKIYLKSEAFRSLVRIYPVSVDILKEVKAVARNLDVQQDLKIDANDMAEVMEDEEKEEEKKEEKIGGEIRTRRAMVEAVPSMYYGEGKEDVLKYNISPVSVYNVTIVLPHQNTTDVSDGWTYRMDEKETLPIWTGPDLRESSKRGSVYGALLKQTDIKIANCGCKYGLRKTLFLFKTSSGATYGIECKRLLRMMSLNMKKVHALATQIVYGRLVYLFYLFSYFRSRYAMCY